MATVYLPAKDYLQGVVQVDPAANTVMERIIDLYVLAVTIFPVH